MAESEIKSDDGRPEHVQLRPLGLVHEQSVEVLPKSRHQRPDARVVLALGAEYPLHDRLVGTPVPDSDESVENAATPPIGKP